MIKFTILIKKIFMSPSFKGILSIILSVLFFYPWIWTSILHVKPTALVSIIGTLVVSIIAAILGFQARKEGSKILGIIGLTLGLISIVLSIINITAII